MNLRNLWIKLMYVFDTVFIFFMLKLLETSGMKLTKLRIRTNFIISSSDFP